MRDIDVPPPLNSRPVWIRDTDPVDGSWPPPPGPRHDDVGSARSWDELRSTGLLWLINASVFHPRGYALALHRNLVTGKIDGWSLFGDGQERWSFEDPDPLPQGVQSLDELFTAAKETLS